MPPMSFAQDIRPMFREEDIQEMKDIADFDMSKFEDVRAHADDIYERVADGSMPCEGGWSDEQIAKFKTQQMQTRKNEEFQAFGLQIKHFEGEITKIEDRELEIMEAMEADRPALAAAERSVAEAKERVARQIGELEEKAAILKGQLETAEAGRKALTEGISEETLEEYERLFATKGGQAVVAADHEFCTGCHMKLITQTLVKVKGNHEIATCEDCGRILYYVP